MFIQNTFLFPGTSTVGHGHMQRVSMAAVAQLDWCQSLVFCECAYLPWQGREELLLFLKSS